jgi:protoporphyrinogen/coproporphyrinogen III oxidase
MTAQKVVIIGAGCAGLSAAYTLRKLGVDFVLFEASSQVGGRCRTEVEDGYEFYIGAGSTEPQWATTFQYLQELGLEERVYSVQKQRYGFYRNGRIRTVFMGGNFMDTLRTLPENIRFLFTGIPLKAYVQIMKVFSALGNYTKQVDTTKHDFTALAEISNMSTEEFVLKHGGPLALEWFFHPFLSLMVLARPRDISIAHPISLFSLMKGMRSLEGGMGVITAGLYEQVKDSVQLNTPVQKVVIRDNRVVGVETRDGFVEADQVICGVDAVLARRIIPDLPEAMRRPLETCQYSSTYYYQFGLEKPIVDPKDTPMYVVTMPPGVDTVLDFLSLGSNSREKPVVIIPTRGWEDEKLAGLSPQERRSMVINEVRKFVPEFPPEPKITKVYRWERAVNTEPPGQYNAIQDLLKNHMQDVSGLYLAGEYLFLIACTEGAMATGKQAAERVVDDLRNERL